MKKIKLFFSIAILATLLFAACKPKEPEYEYIPPTPQEIGVEINGVVWSPYNMGGQTMASPYAHLMFASTPENYGEYCRLTNAACPKGWRVPTAQEFKTLFLDTKKVYSEWTTEKYVKGRRFIDKMSDNTIFLPAAGFYRDGLTERLGEGQIGCYLSSTNINDKLAYVLLFYNDNDLYNDIEINSANDKCRISLRCVAE